MESTTQGASPDFPQASGGGGAAGPLSIATLGLSAFSSVAKGSASQSSYGAQADRAERAADFGRLQANLTDVTLRDELNRTLGNIDVIRAAGRIDPTSPTTAALLERETMVSDRQRNAALLNIRSQVNEDEASATYLRQAGDYALRMGYLDAGIKVAGAVGKAVAL